MTRRRRRRRGFTLVELIVAIGLTSVVGLAVLAVTSGVVATQRRGDSAATAVNDLRAAAALFERDVRCAAHVEITDDGAKLGAAEWRRDGARLLRRVGRAEDVVLRGVTAFRATRADPAVSGAVRAEMSLAPVAGEPRGPAVVAVAAPRSAGAR